MAQATVNKETKTVKATFFKDTGKYYTEEDIEVPAELVQVFDIVEWLEKNVHSHKRMHMVCMLNEYENGYPCMIPADRR